jgi:hypothetical protein
MDDYGIAFAQATLTNTGFKTAVVVAAAAAAASGIQIRRGRLIEVNFGQNGAPSATDCAILYDISRSTTLGTASALVPNPVDGADAVFMGQCAQNHTVEPTIAAAGSGLSLFQIPVNQRGAYRWTPKDGRELVYPATASNGFAIRGQVSTASAYTGPGGGSAVIAE